MTIDVHCCGEEVGFVVVGVGGWELELSENSLREREQMNKELSRAARR